MPKRFTIRSGYRAADAGSTLPVAPVAPVVPSTSGSWVLPPEREAELVAARVLVEWQAIVNALTPVIGPHGMYALYRRTLTLAAETHPWLPPPHEDASISMELTSLRHTLGQHTITQARAASSTMLETIKALLVSLIGLPLTNQLLLPSVQPAAAQTDSDTVAASSSPPPATS